MNCCIVFNHQLGLIQEANYNIRFQRLSSTIFINFHQRHQRLCGFLGLCSGFYLATGWLLYLLLALGTDIYW